MEGEVIVYIKNQTNSGNGTAINPKTGQEQQPEEETGALQRSSLASVMINQAYEYAKSIVVNEVSYEVNKYFDLTDDYETKRDLNIAIGVAKKVGGIAVSTAAGAKLGASFGPVGAIIGGVIGFTGSTVGEAINIYQSYDKQSITMKQRNKQLEYTRVRSGYSLTSGSVGENL